MAPHTSQGDDRAVRSRSVALRSVMEGTGRVITRNEAKPNYLNTSALPLGKMLEYVITFQSLFTHGLIAILVSSH